MSFEENMTAFYMAFAEQKLDQLCQSLGNMRLVVQNDSVQQRDRAAAATTAAEDARFADDVAVREEMLHACEMKAQTLQEPMLAKLKELCSPSSAAAVNDVDIVLNQFYLCAELGCAPAGAAAFTGYMSRTFKTQSRAVLDRVADFKKTAPVNEHGYIERNFYVEAMSEIMTGATDVMNAVADVTPDALTLRKILAPIHDICTEFTLEIVHIYAIDARMTAWERRALDQARRDPREQTEVESDESLQMVDLLLDELSFIIRIIMGYSAFAKTICDGLDGASDTRSSFGVKIQELNGVYLILERFYIFQSTHKATEIAEVQELESHVFVSSIVEDVSFVLNKSFFRVCQCTNYHTALSVVIALVDALESSYLPSIVNLPNRAFVMPQSSAIAAPAPVSAADDEENGGHDGGVSFSDMLLAAVDDDLTKSVQEEAKLIMAINSAFMSGEFVESLEIKIDEFCSTSFPDETAITECLPKPISELKESFRAIVSNEVKEVLTSGISKRMEPLINRLVLERIEYVLTPSQYDDFGLHGSALNKLVEFDVMKNKVLRRYQTALCAPAFEDLVEIFVQELTKWIEAALVRFRKMFNDLGALQLEREVTDMLDRVSELVQTKSLRSSFTRLFQLVLVVNLMQPAEIVDYADSITNEFTAQEIETFLRMRVDFKPDDVRRAMSELKRATPARH